MIREAAVRCLKPFGRAARRVTLRLTGYCEIRAQLDRQEAALRGLEESLRRVLARDEAKRESDPVGGDLRSLRESVASLGERLETLAREQSALGAAVAEGLKATETAVVGALVDEVNRLDGYWLFHANELREAIAGRGGSTDAAASPLRHGEAAQKAA